MMSIPVAILLFYTVPEHSVMVSARGRPGSTCGWNGVTSLSLSLSLSLMGSARGWPGSTCIPDSALCGWTGARLSTSPCPALLRPHRAARSAYLMSVLVSFALFTRWPILPFGMSSGRSGQRLHPPCVAGQVSCSLPLSLTLSLTSTVSVGEQDLGLGLPLPLPMHTILLAHLRRSQAASVCSGWGAAAAAASAPGCAGICSPLVWAGDGGRGQARRPRPALSRPGRRPQRGRRRPRR